MPPWYAIQSKKRSGLCRCKDTAIVLFRQIIIHIVTALPYHYSFFPICQRAFFFKLIHSIGFVIRLIFFGLKIRHDGRMTHPPGRELTFLTCKFFQ